MNSKNCLLQTTLSRTPTIPVLVINDLSHAKPLAEALVAGGLPIIEITLRTPVSLAAIEAMSSVEGAIIGSGTVRNASHIQSSIDAGAQFMVAPGASPKLLDAADEVAVPLLPGATTPTEIMTLNERGYQILKFFPAETMGGVSALRHLAGPLSDIQFCPTGGINSGNAKQYLELDNVICVGGSWMAPQKLIMSESWPEITKLATAAAEICERQ